MLQSRWSASCRGFVDRADHGHLRRSLSWQTLRGRTKLFEYRIKASETEVGTHVDDIVLHRLDTMTRKEWRNARIPSSDSRCQFP